METGTDRGTGTGTGRGRSTGWGWGRGTGEGEGEGGGGDVARLIDRVQASLDDQIVLKLDRDPLAHQSLEKTVEKHR